MPQQTLAKTDTGPTRAARPRSVSLSLPAAQHEALAGAAQAHGVSVALLGRVLVAFGIDELGRGNTEIDRAIKTSRDAKRPAPPPSRR
jgi:hypothetical protein